MDRLGARRPVCTVNRQHRFPLPLQSAASNRLPPLASRPLCRGSNGPPTTPRARPAVGEVLDGRSLSAWPQTRRGLWRSAEVGAPLNGFAPPVCENAVRGRVSLLDQAFAAVQGSAHSVLLSARSPHASPNRVHPVSHAASITC
ncbi:hypothetical protein AAFF_G00389890 [Aldrovandia affinis]|uniref:Uncharacterized protein n=1 Tax=Aldrovandia affinis TaxID=143900 RepID=A0AAD7SEX8_9TELE|nr:hypothetical protein AAFF_G00389890 [Aldrovandia affinis]